MRKMALKPVTFSFLPTLPLPPLECAPVFCNAICLIMVGAQQIEAKLTLKRVLGKIHRLNKALTINVKAQLMERDAIYVQSLLHL